MARITEEQLEKTLAEYADGLGITKEQRKNAEEKYIAIGEWLNSGDFFKDYAPIIYPQGSFALGTVVRPGEGEEFDLDIVVKLTRGDILHSSKEIKDAVNERMTENNANNPCLDATKKKNWIECYTLMFPKKFSMDIVPARSEDKAVIHQKKVLYPHAERFLDGAIQIADSKDQWQPSNPDGYVQWFMELSRSSVRKPVMMLNEQVRELPDNEAKTPLQQMVQILKKHASEMFSDDELHQYKPPSIAITTLAALSYKKEYSLYDALKNFKTNALKIMGDKLELENPANPREWFSSNWENDEKKKQYFIEWLCAVDLFIQNLLNLEDNTDKIRLNNMFKEAKIIKPGQISEYQKYLSNTPLPVRAPHAEEPFANKNIKYQVSITPKIKVDELWRRFDNFNIFPLPKNKELRFEAQTDCPPPYKIRWQVVNTGDEAKDDNCLRGNILDCAVDKESNKITIRRECTRYTGIHWVQCYVYDNNGTIVAESSKCYVPIR